MRTEEKIKKDLQATQDKLSKLQQELIKAQLTDIVGQTFVSDDVKVTVLDSPDNSKTSVLVEAVTTRKAKMDPRSLMKWERVGE